MTAQRHPANRKTGQRGGRKTQEALARLHSARSLNRSQGFTAEGGGSSLAPLGRRSFMDEPTGRSGFDSRSRWARSDIETTFLTRVFMSQFPVWGANQGQIHRDSRR